MTTTEPRGAHAPLTVEQHAERTRRGTAELDRALRRLIADHDLPTPAATSHRVEDDGARSLIIVAGDAEAWETWSPHIDSTGVVSPGPYRCGAQTLRYRVGRLTGTAAEVTTVLIVDDALRVLAARRSDVTLDAERDPETGAAVTS